MQDNFKISVVIPTYNRSRELIRAIKSVLNQTFPVLEILVCDDGSTDDAKEKVMALTDKKIKWVDCGKNGGPAVPRNTGIKLSQGNWVAFLDNDDEWLPDKLQLQVIALQKDQTKACCCNAFKITNDGSAHAFSNFSKQQIRLTDLMLCNWIICSSMLVSKELLLKVSVFPEEKKYIALEDYCLWLRLVTKNNITYLHEPLLNYYDNSANSIRSNYNDNWAVMALAFGDYKNWLKQNKIKLDKEQQSELKILNKKIITKGQPSALDEFIRKAKAKLKLNK